jgi:uncharacterized protein (DUF1330 family)
MAIATVTSVADPGEPILCALTDYPNGNVTELRISDSLATGRRIDMPKGYWIAHVGVRGEEGYNAYSAAIPATLRRYGGRFLVRGGKFECVEGTSRSRNVLIEFPDYASAVACYRSPEYQTDIKMRQPHAIVDLIIIEGYDGPQP